MLGIFTHGFSATRNSLPPSLDVSEVFSVSNADNRSVERYMPDMWQGENHARGVFDHEESTGAMNGHLRFRIYALGIFRPLEIQISLLLVASLHTVNSR